MKTIEEKRLDFINSELYFYINNPNQRSIGAGTDMNCYYRHPDGTKSCLIGRQIPNEVYTPNLEGKSLTVKRLKLLPESVQELGFTFLSRLQHLHDFEEYWTPDFNELGKTKLNKIIKIYCSIR